MKNISLNVSAVNHILIEEEELDSALNSCLGVLGENLKACRSYIYTIVNECIDESYSWVDPSLEELKDEIPKLNYLCRTIPETFNPLRKGFHIIGNTVDIKEQTFKHLMTERKVETFLFIPIFDNDVFWGFIGFEHCKGVVWNSEMVESIKIFTKNISIKINEIRYKKNVGPSFDIFRYYHYGVLEGFWELDLITKELKLANNWANLLGFSIYEVEQTYDFLRSRYHPDDLVEIEKKRNKFISGEIDEYTGIARVKNKEGNYIWIQYSGILRRNAKGEPIKIFGTILDVDEIEKSKIALEESESKLRFILENSTDLISQRKSNGEYIYVSESSKDILGYTPQEFMQLNSKYELFNPDNLKIYLKDLSNFMNDKDCISQMFNVQLLNKDGNYVWLEVLSKKIIVNNTLICIQSTARDITLRMKLEIESQKAIAREKELYDLKSKFIAMASHQFKTPLTVIYSNAELIEIKAKSIEKKVADNFVSISNRIKFEINRMAELIENIIIFGKYDTEENVSLKLEKINFDEFFSNLIEVYFDNESDSRKVELIIEGQPKMINTDTSLLIHIFTNLLNNAFKYSKGKQNPLVRINYLKEKIQVEVIDYGIGIPEQDVKNLFKSFFRASNTSTIIGSGLGLTIVKQFTRLLKGKIKLKTKENSGTKITLTFPYEQE